MKVTISLKHGHKVKDLNVSFKPITKTKPLVLDVNEKNEERIRSAFDSGDLNCQFYDPQVPNNDIDLALGVALEGQEVDWSKHSKKGDTKLDAAVAQLEKEREVNRALEERLALLEAKISESPKADLGDEGKPKEPKETKKASDKKKDKKK